jgi:t-SNARE complex subunit (syntaxin)
MNNLLGTFQEEWNDEELESSDEENEDGDVEMNKQQQQQQPTNHPNYMENFFREVDSIKIDVDAVSEAVTQIAVIHEQALSATTNDDEQALSRQLRPVIENTNKRAQRTKTLLKLLKEETDKLKEEETLNASDIRCVVKWRERDMICSCVYFFSS